MPDIDKKIKSKEEALIALTQKLKNKQTEVNKEVKKLDKLHKSKAKETFEKLAEFEQMMEEPEQTISMAKERLKKREGELIQWELDLQEESKALAKSEIAAMKSEKKIQLKTLEINRLFAEYVQRLYQRLQVDAKSLKVKVQMFEARGERVKQQQNILNDQIRVYKNANKELLNKTNGRSKRKA